MWDTVVKLLLQLLQFVGDNCMVWLRRRKKYGGIRAIVHVTLEATSFNVN